METKTVFLADRVFEQFEEDILSGKYHKGDILTETKLSTAYGVSRTPVREAVRRLQTEGLVRECGKGIQILGVSTDDLADIYDVRMHIEGMVARRAAERVTDEELAQMKEVLDLHEFYTAKGSVERLKETDNAFHTAIYKSCGSVLLEELLTMLHRKIQMYRKQSLTEPVRAKQVTEEHRAIYNALLLHDADRAEELLVTHVRNARDNMQKCLTKTGMTTKH